MIEPEPFYGCAVCGGATAGGPFCPAHEPDAPVAQGETA